MKKSIYERWQSGEISGFGSFQTSILKAYQIADQGNQQRLKNAFPEWFMTNEEQDAANNLGLSEEKCKEILHSALCNSGHVHYGDMQIWANEAVYNTAKAGMDNPCREDVWMKMLEMTNHLHITDNEDGADYCFDLGQAIKGIRNLPQDIIAQFLSGEDDADSADYVIEYILFGEKIYG